MSVCTLSWFTALVVLVYAIIGGFGWALGSRILARLF
jgi:hypothetical protein